jgi:glutamate carboxypeptidase
VTTNTVDRYLCMTDQAAIRRVLERSQRYVEQETPSGGADAINRLSLMVEHDLLACGARVEHYDAPGFGRNLLARIKGTEEGAPVVVMAHIDTVHPVGTLAARPFRVEDGRAYGPGIYDMKTGLAVAIEALAWLREQGRKPAPGRPPPGDVRRGDRLALVPGSHCRAGQERRCRAGARAVPADGGVKTFRKGVATYRMEATGKAAHAGIDGDSAVSAISELVHGLGEALKLPDHAGAPP